MAGPPFYYFNKQYTFTFFETIFFSVLGGMVGVVVFSFFSDLLFQFWHFIHHKFTKVITKREKVLTRAGSVEGANDIKYSSGDDKAKKKIFNPHSRRIVRVWSEWGIIGIAFITPVLLSIPIGTIIACRLVHRKRKIFTYMFFSILFWSILITSIFELYHVITLQDLGKQIVP